MNATTIIPQPQKMTANGQQFTLTPASKIVYTSNSAASAAELLAEYLRPATGFKLAVQDGNAQTGDIILGEEGNSETDDAGFVDETYAINVTNDNIQLNAENSTGLARSIQTLRQLFPAAILSDQQIADVEWQVEGVEIKDTPAFRWRGMHLDVSRHFFTVKEVCRMIDLLALHRYNILHWHLTEDQGWRIEIKKYPKLTEVGSVRKGTLIGHYYDSPRRYDMTPYDGYYTQDDIREVVAYAAKRHITIVPEIDMPGHMQAAIAAYPELGNNNHQLDVRCLWGISKNILNPKEETVQFMKDVLAEVIELFPSKFIHIGGDEALKDEWVESIEVHERMQELGVKDENELQSWFISQMNDFITANGRRLIGWDEILEGGLADGATVMSWRGEKGGIKAAQQGNNVVMSSQTHTYFDYYQAEPASEEPLAIGGMLPPGKVYDFNPIPKALSEEEGKLVLGGQGQLWTEYIPTMAQLEYMAFPRACALAEVLWGKPEGAKYNTFLERLDSHRKRLDTMKVNAHPRA